MKPLTIQHSERRYSICILACIRCRLWTPQHLTIRPDYRQKQDACRRPPCWIPSHHLILDTCTNPSITVLNRRVKCCQCIASATYFPDSSTCASCLPLFPYAFLFSPSYRVYTFSSILFLKLCSFATFILLRCNTTVTGSLLHGVSVSVL